MKQLKTALEGLKAQLSAEDKEALDDKRLSAMTHVYPFNKDEYVLSYLLAKGKITLDQYQTMRSEYFQRNCNLKDFELSSRPFGAECEKRLKKIVPSFQRPARKLDPNYKNQQYDWWLDGIRVEVKATRVVRKDDARIMPMKALGWDVRLTESYDMIFQQLKPDCCDVFVWLAIWRDQTDYWVLSSEDVRNNPLFSNQHRNSVKSGGKITEGQIHINKANYNDFETFRSAAGELEANIKRAAGR